MEISETVRWKYRKLVTSCYHFTDLRVEVVSHCSFYRINLMHKRLFFSDVIDFSRMACLVGRNTLGGDRPVEILYFPSGWARNFCFTHVYTRVCIFIFSGFRSVPICRQDKILASTLGAFTDISIRRVLSRIFSRGDLYILHRSSAVDRALYIEILQIITLRYTR